MKLNSYVQTLIFLAQCTAFILYTSEQIQIAQNIYTAAKVNASYNEQSATIHTCGPI